MRSGFLGGGIGPRAIARRIVRGWWLAGGTISAAQIAEYVENPAAGQLYAGGTLVDAWTVSLRTNLATLDVADYELAFDAENGRFYVFIRPIQNGFFPNGNAINLFATGDHSYMLISDGSGVQAYRDNSAIGAGVATPVDIGGAVRWRSRYSGDSYFWPVAIRAGHVANIALDATQRAALHASMMALA